MLFSQRGHPEGGGSCGRNGEEFQFDQAESQLSEEYPSRGTGGFWSTAWAGGRESLFSLLEAGRRRPWSWGQDLEGVPI